MKKKNVILVLVGLFMFTGILFCESEEQPKRLTVHYIDGVSQYSGVSPLHFENKILPEYVSTWMFNEELAGTIHYHPWAQGEPMYGVLNVNQTPNEPEFSVDPPSGAGADDVTHIWISSTCAVVEIGQAPNTGTVSGAEKNVLHGNSGGS